MYKFCTHCGAKMPNENAFCHDLLLLNRII